MKMSRFKEYTLTEHPLDSAMERPKCECMWYMALKKCESDGPNHNKPPFFPVMPKDPKSSVRGFISTKALIMASVVPDRTKEDGGKSTATCQSVKCSRRCDKESRRNNKRARMSIEKRRLKKRRKKRWKKRKKWFLLTRERRR